MNPALKNYECDGQMDIFDILSQNNEKKSQKDDLKVYEVDYIGLCDDPICPVCGYYFKDYGPKSEVDCERCPECGIRVDWTRWHKINDKKELGGIPLDELIEQEKQR